MAMAASSIRFEPQEKELIQSFAKAKGTTLSALIREWVLERLEDEMDARDLLEAIREDDGSWVSWDEAKRQLGLEE